MNASNITVFVLGTLVGVFFMNWILARRRFNLLKRHCREHHSYYICCCDHVDPFVRHK